MDCDTCCKGEYEILSAVICDNVKKEDTCSYVDIIVLLYMHDVNSGMALI